MIHIKGNEGDQRQEMFAAHLMGSSKDPAVEIANLRVENERLSTAVSKYKEQISTLTKKLNETIVSYRSAVQKMKSMQHNSGGKGQEVRIAALQKEIEAFKKRVDSGKKRENDLTKKLSASLEEIKKLQSRIRQGNAA